MFLKRKYRNVLKVYSHTQNKDVGLIYNYTFLENSMLDSLAQHQNYKICNRYNG